MSALDEIAAERRRQVEVEGWHPDHDDIHNRGQMAAAAGCYALASTWDDGAMFATVSRYPARHGASGRNFGHLTAASVFWPWDWKWWKPRSKRENLIRAAALIVAEIERLDRSGQGPT